MSSAYNVCFLYLSDVKHIISLRIHAVSIVTLIDAFTAFNPMWTHHEHFSSPNPYIGSWDARHAKSGLHVVSRDVTPTSILAFHYILLYTWLQTLQLTLSYSQCARNVTRSLTHYSLLYFQLYRETNHQRTRYYTMWLSVPGPNVLYFICSSLYTCDVLLT